MIPQLKLRVNLPDGAIVRLGKGGVSYEDRGIAFSPDGSRLAVVSSMGVWLYDTETFDEITLLTDATSVAFSPDGTEIASGSSDGTVLLWDVPKSIKLYPSKQHSDR